MSLFDATKPFLCLYSLWHMSAVLLWQVGGQDVFVQRRHVFAVEVDFLLHALVQEWFEHLEHRIECPVLVDDVNGQGAHRHRRHHQADNLLRDGRAHLQAVVQCKPLKVEDSHSAHDRGDGLQGTNLQNDQGGPKEVRERDLRWLPVPKSVDHQTASCLVAIRSHSDDVLVPNHPEVQRADSLVQLLVLVSELVVTGHLGARKWPNEDQVHRRGSYI